MNNIYQEAIQAVEEGAKFKVDFQSRSLKLDGKFIIQNGKYEGDLGVSGCSEDDFLRMWKNYIIATNTQSLQNVAKVSRISILWHCLKES